MKKSHQYTLLKPIAFFLLYTSLFPTLVRAATTVNVIQEHVHNSSNDVDLISFLTLKSQKHDELFTEANELLESIKSSPSCNQIAASKLAASCQSIGRKPDIPIDPDTPQALEHVRSLYAARLAICELSGAGTSIPSPCHPVNASPYRRKGIFGFGANHNPATSDNEPVPKEVLEACLKSLESRPQWWTSYSNSRQNAVVLCQAWRTEIEKEEILELYQTIVKSSIKLKHGLHDALRTAAEDTSSHRAFTQSTELLRKEIMHEMKESISIFQKSFGRVSQNLETQFSSFIETITSALGGLQTGLTSLEKGLRNSSSEANNLREALRAIHDETISRSEQVALRQQQNAETHNGLALFLQSRLQSILQNDIFMLVEIVGTFNASLESLDTSVAKIRERGESVSVGFRNIESSLEKFQVGVEDLHQIQQRQYEIATNQSKLQDEMQTNTRILKAFLDQTVSTAADLRAMIDETAAKYREAPGLSGLFGSYSPWVMYGILLSLAKLQAPKYAIVMFLIYVSTNIL
ncbi:hypothetical protein BDW59DRAFT_163648 [Aspergillus cavernicola]|uniref:Nuclear membrane fusion protein Kar5 n=1 Tax=Aspergillus cavernicola TaxID=176166 RepID=A0ABR4I7G8_9EURO